MIITSIANAVLFKINIALHELPKQGWLDLSVPTTYITTHSNYAHAKTHQQSRPYSNLVLSSLSRVFDDISIMPIRI